MSFQQAEMFTEKSMAPEHRIPHTISHTFYYPVSVLSGENTNAVIKSAVPEKNDTEGAAGDANSGQVTVQTGTTDQAGEFKMVIGAYRYKTVVVKSNTPPFDPIKYKDDKGIMRELKVFVVVGKKDVAVSLGKLFVSGVATLLSSVLKKSSTAAVMSAAPGALAIPVVGDLIKVFVEDIPAALLQHSLSDGMNLFLDVCFHDASTDMSRATYGLDDERLDNRQVDGWQLIKVIAFFAFTGHNDVIKLFPPAYQFVGKFIGYVLKDTLLGTIKRVMDKIVIIAKIGQESIALLKAFFGCIRTLIDNGIEAALEAVSKAFERVGENIRLLVQTALNLINAFVTKITNKIQDWCEAIKKLMDKSKGVAETARRESISEAKLRDGETLEEVAKRQTLILNDKAKVLLDNDMKSYAENVDGLYDEAENKEKKLMEESITWKDDTEAKLIEFGEEESESEVKNAILSPLVELMANKLFAPGIYNDIGEIFPELSRIGDYANEGDISRNTVFVSQVNLMRTSNSSTMDSVIGRSVSISV